MDQLQGDRASWQLTAEADAIRIRYRPGLRQDAMLKRLGQCTVPVAALSSVDFHPLAKRRSWSVRLHLREQADPYAAAGAALAPRSDPFLLTGSAQSALLAEYWADQLTLAAQRAPAGPVTEQWLADRIAADLVPSVPLHIQTGEGTGSFDGSTVTLVWSGSSASSRKRKAQRREFPLSGITGVEWVPSDGWEWGFLRMLTKSHEFAKTDGPTRQASSDIGQRRGSGLRLGLSQARSANLSGPRRKFVEGWVGRLAVG